MCFTFFFFFLSKVSVSRCIFLLPGKKKKMGQERRNQGKGCLEIQFVGLSDAASFLYRDCQFPFSLQGVCGFNK